MTKTLLALLAIPLIALAACEPAQTGPPAAGPNAVEIEITATPTGSLVLVDGARVGPAPQKVKLNPGPHRIKGMKSGYFPAEQRVTVSSGAPSPTVHLTLVASH
jgi:hypothetical protein